MASHFTALTDPQSLPTRVRIYSLLVAVAFWFVDSAIDFWLFDSESWEKSILPQEASAELWMRSLAFILIISIGLFAARNIRLQREITEKLRSEIAERQLVQEALTRSERAIHKLYELTADQETSFDRILENLLEFGCRHFDLPFGIVSRITDHTYEVIQVVPSGAQINPGDSFPLGITYCMDTIKSPKPIFIDVATSPKWRQHPAYKAFELEAYIGVRIEVHGKVYGTLNFASASPWHHRLSQSNLLGPSDLDLLKFMARWIGRDLERQQHQAILSQAATVFDNTDECIIIADALGIVLNVNPAFSTTSGYKATEVVDSDINWFRNISDHGPSCSTLWLQVIAKGRGQGEIGFCKKDQKIIPVWLTISSVNPQSADDIQYVLLFSDISRIRRYQDQLAHLAHHDPLTDLPNRTLFAIRLDHVLDNAHRHRRTTALLMIDLDGFKKVNDTLGHAVGDQLLQIISKDIKNCVRDADMVARLGGDEFTVILEEAGSIEDTTRVAEKILTTICSITNINKQPIQISASIGVALFPDDADNAETLLKAADIAMYTAKSGGKQQVRFATPHQ